MLILLYGHKCIRHRPSVLCRTAKTEQTKEKKRMKIISPTPARPLDRTLPLFLNFRRHLKFTRFTAEGRLKLYDATGAKTGRTDVRGASGFIGAKDETKSPVGIKKTAPNRNSTSNRNRTKPILHVVERFERDAERNKNRLPTIVNCLLVGSASFCVCSSAPSRSGSSSCAGGPFG